MVVFAQLSTSVSDDQVRLIILALLGVAVLLALLTAWYAVKTSPRRRVRAAQARRGRAPGAGTTARPDTPADTTTAATTHAGAAGASTGRTATQPDAAVDDDDEWTRLTAPQQQRSTNG